MTAPATASGSGARGAVAAAHANERDELLRGMSEKNRELMARLQALEENKTKAIMRLVAQMSVSTATGSTAGGGGGGAGGAAAPTEPAGALSPPPTGLAGSGGGGGAASLQLSENGIEDREASLLAAALRTNSVASEVILRKNRISDDGLLTLSSAVLAATSRVSVLDLQDNAMTMDGLEALAILIHSHSTTSKSSPTAAASAAAGEPPKAVTVLSAGLQIDEKKVVPVVELKLAGSTVGRTNLLIDLRYNKLKGKKSMRSLSLLHLIQSRVQFQSFANPNPPCLCLVSLCDDLLSPRSCQFPVRSYYDTFAPVPVPGGSDRRDCISD